MNVVVFGSTGQTGLQLVEQLVAAGHTVTAFARTPAKVNTFAGKVRVIQGDARDIEGIRTAVKGQDAVFNAVAQRYLKKDDLQTVFAGLLTQAMEEAGVTRLIVLSAWGSGDSATQAIFLFKILRFTMLRNVFKDKADAEEIIEKSNLTYTLVRPGILGNGPAIGHVKGSLSKAGMKPRINRADVAGFMIAQLTSPNWERKAPLISYE